MELADAKRERTGDLGSLDLNLESLDDKAKLNQILKVHDVKVALKHDHERDEDLLEMVIGSWDNFHVDASVNDRTPLRGAKIHRYKELGSKGVSM